MEAEQQSNERGASAMEVGLIIAVIAIVALGALKLLGGNSSTELETAAEATEDAGDDDGGGSGGGGGGGGGSTPGGGGGGGSGTTTTTASGLTTTTTAPPSPPTTAATTTTAPPPPPTTIPPLSDDWSYPDSSGFAGPDVDTSNYGNSWDATTSLVVRDADGQPVPGATATVEVWREVRCGRGCRSWLHETIEVTTGPDGSVVISSGTYPTGGSDRVYSVEFRLVGATPSWDGVQHVESADRPR